MYNFLGLPPIPEEEQLGLFLLFVLFSLSHLTLCKRNKKLQQNKNCSCFLGRALGLTGCQHCFNSSPCLDMASLKCELGKKVHSNLFVSKRVCVSMELVKLN